MAKISLKEALANKKQSQFDFTGFTYTYDNNNKKVVTLELVNPIPYVSGSQSITDGNESVKLDAYDVTHVKIHEDDMVEGIDVNEDESGTVDTDALRLDVSRAGEVWLRSKSFAASGADYRRERTSTRDAGVLQKLRAAKSKGISAVAGKPNSTVEPVDTN